jgi:hypothetical protein
MGIDYQHCDRCGAQGVNGSLQQHTVEIEDIDRTIEYCVECDDIDTRMFLDTVGKTEEEIDDMEDEWNKDDDHTIKLTLSLAYFLEVEDAAKVRKAQERLKVIRSKLPKLKKKNKRDLRRASHKKWLEAREAKAEERREKMEKRRAEKLKSQQAAAATTAVVA